MCRSSHDGNPASSNFNNYDYGGSKMEQFNRFLVQFISKDLDGTESVEVEDFEVEHPMSGEEIARWTLAHTDDPKVHITRVYAEGGRRIGEAHI